MNNRLHLYLAAIFFALGACKPIEQPAPEPNRGLIQLKDVSSSVITSILTHIPVVHEEVSQTLHSHDDRVIEILVGSSSSIDRGKVYALKTKKPEKSPLGPLKDARKLKGYEEQIKFERARIIEAITKGESWTLSGESETHLLASLVSVKFAVESNPSIESWRILIVSDMIEESPLLDLTKISLDNHATARELAAQSLAQLDDKYGLAKGDFQKVETVRILLPDNGIGNQQKHGIDGNLLLSFWRETFRQLGVNNVVLNSIGE